VLLDSEPDLTVVGDAGTGREALEVAAATAPDVVLMDVRMPDMDGIAATAALVARDPDRPRVLVLTTFEDDDYLYGRCTPGASGFALKRSSPEELAHAIRVVASGTSLVLPDLTRRLIAGRAARHGRAATRHCRTSPPVRPTSCAGWPPAAPTPRSPKACT
jgi:DNA-binding NarL/FixJ family response regulator